VRICVIGKFPPIQGGVSMRTYWAAHGLAARGHDVHVITNAKEAEPPFRMFMRKQDWRRCAGRYAAGSVTVHWTDPADGTQAYIPMASPFVSKLATLVARAHAERPFDVLYSHYLEPYGVAGHLAAEMTGVPHVVRMAGSDAGRLWHHPQLELLHDHVLRSAARVIVAGRVAERAIGRGIAPERIALGGAFDVPEDLFKPRGPGLDLARLRQEVEADPVAAPLMWGDVACGRPYFGVYGKLGHSKGSFSLLAALGRLKREGLDAGLVALAHGQPEVEQHFRATARRFGLADRVLQIPFLPHWRVPEFIRGCLAVCCLEQDFPIAIHSPIVAREVLLCGTCLVASTEMIRKLPGYERLPNRYGCVAVDDVNDVGALSDRLAAMVRDPEPAAAMGARGHAYARDLQRDLSFVGTLEEILAAAVAGEPIAPSSRPMEEPAPAGDARFRLTRLVAEAMGMAGRPGLPEGAAAASTPVHDVARARQILAAVDLQIGNGHTGLEGLALAVATEIAVAKAEADESDPVPEEDPIFRLRGARWGVAPGDMAKLVPLCAPQVRVLTFDHDVAEFMSVRKLEDFPRHPAKRPSFIVAFAGPEGHAREPLLIDELTARILGLCDGTRTVSEVIRALDGGASAAIQKKQLQWIARLFQDGLIALHDDRAAGTGSRHRRAAGGRGKTRNPTAPRV